ncbi:hypothetical protein ABZ646_06890 [Streptomyces sp. NPDC007162]|uniref:hypothetical protein n=1 Tax=Streptomyces sp. NPDC007162 TaxID=3156917 RepID=UPI0033EB92F6
MTTQQPLHEGLLTSVECAAVRSYEHLAGVERARIAPRDQVTRSQPSAPVAVSHVFLKKSAVTGAGVAVAGAAPAPAHARRRATGPPSVDWRLTRDGTPVF